MSDNNKIKNKETASDELQIDSMSVAQCESALNALMAELEAIESSEPCFAPPSEFNCENVEENVSQEADFKELDGKKAGDDAIFAFKLTDLPEEDEAENDIFANEKIESIDDIYGETLFETAARLVVEEGVTSVSFLQRSLGIGYDKASEIVKKLEELAIISPVDGNRPRRVLVSAEKLERILASIR